MCVLGMLLKLCPVIEHFIVNSIITHNDNVKKYHIMCAHMYTYSTCNKADDKTQVGLPVIICTITM